MSSLIRSLKINISTNLQGADVGFKKMASNLRRAGMQMQRAGRTLTKGLTVPIIALGVVALKVGMDFETSMAKVATIADTNVKSLQSLESEVLALSKMTGTAATEINEALYQAISAGADAATVMDLVTVSVLAARGGFTDAATAVDGLTTVLNAYNMETKDAAYLSNLFFITQKKGKIVFGEIAESIGNVAPIAAVMNISVEDLLASIASLTANALDAPIAITGLRTALSNIIKPSADASKLAKQLGIDFSVSAVKSMGFVGFLQMVQEKAGGSSEVLAKLFGNIRAFNAIAVLTSERGLKTMNETLEEMKTNLNATEDAYNTMTDTAAVQLKIALNSLKLVGIELSKVLLPVLRDQIIPAIKKFANWVSNLIEKFNEASAATKTLKTAGLLLLVSIGPIITVFGKLYVGIGKYVKALGLARAAQAANSSGLAAFLGPAGLAMVAIVALVAVIALLTVAYKAATAEERKLKKETDNLITASNSMTEAHKKQSEELATNKTLTKELVDEMFALNEKTRRTTSEKDRLKVMVGQLNGMYGELNLTINETTGKLEQEEDAIYDVIRAQQERLELEALNVQKFEVMKKRVELQTQLAVVTGKVAEAFGIEASAVTVTTGAFEGYGSALGKTKKDLLLQSFRAIVEELEDVGLQYNYVTGEIEEMGTIAAETASSIVDSTVKTELQLQAMAATVLAGSETYAAAAQLSKEEFQSLAQSMATSANFTQAELDTMFTLYEEMYGVASASYEEYYAALEAATQSNIDALGGLFGEFNDIQEVSAADLQKWADKKVQTLKDWNTNLDLVAEMTNEKGDKIVNDSILDKLKEMGPTGAGYIAAMATMTETELADYVITLEEIFKAAAETPLEQMGEMPDVVGGIMDDINSEIEKAGLNLEKTAKVGGQGFSSGLAIGIISGKSRAVNAAASVANAVLAEMRRAIRAKSPSKVTEKFGASISDGLRIGILKKSGGAIKAAMNLARATMDAFETTTLTPALAGIDIAQSQNMLTNQNTAQPQNITKNYYDIKVQSAITDKNVWLKINREIEEAKTMENLRRGESS